MNSRTSKKLLSLILVVCMLVGIFAILPISIPVSAEISTSGNYFFKVGATSALANDSRKTFTEAPFEVNETVYIPVSILTAAGLSVSSSSTVTYNGKEVDAVSLGNMYSATGYYASISNMSLIALSKTQNLVTSASNDDQVSLMKKFLFDAIDTDGSTQLSPFSNSDMKTASHPYIFASQSTFDELEEVWMAGRAGEAVDEVLYNYINVQVTEAEKLYDQYAQQDENGNYVDMNTTVNLVRGQQDYIYQIPYKDNGGYDVGGRLGESSNNANRILKLAYAYQVTKDINYAKLAYQFAIYLGQWEHWGPGHMLNAADASSPYAISYDWLYNAWAQLESQGATYKYYNGSELETRSVTVGAIEEIIFTHSIIPGYYSATNDNGIDEAGNQTMPWISTQAKFNGWYYDRENNWNAVCSAGFTVAALALVGSTTSTSNVKIDETVDQVYNPATAITTYASAPSGGNTYRAYCEYVVNYNLYILPRIGLTQYVPDGSYIESNAYWNYGTNNIFEMTAALTSATGNDYGILDGWGLDKTCYYALNTMSSDGISWNYHDSDDVGPQSTEWFMYLGTEDGLNNKTLAGIRRDLNANIKQSPSYMDTLYYMTAEEIGTYEYPELQYYMEGIDGYAVRDSWNSEDGTLFGAFMGEANNVTHGQIDSGSFIYYNKGTRWFCDLGTDQYNAYDFWGSSATENRFKYYPMGAEGNNTLVITDFNNLLTEDEKNSGKGDGALKTTTFFGQYYTGSGVLSSHGDNAYGAYAVIDNTSVYNYDYTYTASGCSGTAQVGSGSAASSALRGMLLTNNRKTFVLQDEVEFKQAQDIAWIGHILPEIEVMISVDGTVAYLSDGETVVKATIVEDENGLGLTWRHAYCTEDEFLFKDFTHEYDYSENVPESEGGSGVAQDDFSAYQKLLIEASGVTILKLAVVIEEVIPGETMNDEAGVGYTWTDMASWEPTADGRVQGSTTPVGGPVATISVTEVIVDDGTSIDPDTPIVDFWSLSRSRKLPQRANSDAELGETVEYTAQSFAELEQIINSNSGNIITVELYQSNDTPITINSECTVNTGGNTLLATSQKYVANVNGKTVVYEKGTLSVTWILASGATVKETYASSSVASYKGNISADKTIREKDNGDGTYSYYTTGNAWSVSEGGKQAKSKDMIVTSENNVFYQTNIDFDGLFVTVNGSTITGYYSANDFFTTNIFEKQYDRISLTSDFGYDGTGKNDARTFRVPANLYLNGYTLTFTSADESDHLFIANGGDFHVYGPGGINSQAESSNMFYNDVTNGDNIYVENADLYSVRAIIDLRCNKATFKNCNITIEKNSNAFTVINRNNAAAVQPYLYVDGCVVNLPAISSGIAVVTLYMNAKAEITGGTTIITAADCYMFQLNNSTVGTVTGFDYSDSYDEMYAILGNVYHTIKNEKLSNSGTNDTSGTTYDMSGRVFYGEGYKYTTEPDVFNVLPGLVKAKLDENSYVLAKAENCASVSWKNTSGSTIATEYWLEGTAPVASSDIRSQITVSSGKMLAFITDVVAGGTSYNYTAIVVDEFGLKVNMSLQEDFNLNFFVEKIGEMTFKIDGVEITPDTSSWSGYYKVAKTGINPANAAKEVILEVTYGDTTLTKKISPVDYAAKILGGNNADVDKRMMINVVKYIEAAYVYLGKNIGTTVDEYNEAYSLYKQYKKYATVAVVDRQAADMSGVTDALGGAQLNLESAPKFRFNLKEDYNGEVSFTYTASDGSRKTATYTVVNGLCGGKSYIEIGFKAYFMTEDIEITTAKGTATYNLANYYYYEINESGTLANLINALYAYCETARIYRDSAN
ncbi:MAG: hypothetical protein IJF05_02675 [Clostridia bacterium]|nr:hypothetical protein [Clostridia bacterium]